MQDFKKLKVWDKAHQMSLTIYKTTSKFPREEMYGLTSQIRRACISIPTNIAEGCGRESKADFARFLYMAVGSASELEYLIMLSNDLILINKEEFVNIYAKIIEIRKMLTKLIKKLKTDN
jgi:four helix bundle protein